MSTSANHLARFLAGGLSAVAIFTLLPFAAAAQSTVAQEATRANKVHIQATNLLASSDRDQWFKAATLLEKAANMRTFEDTVAIHERAMAAEIYANLGFLPQAQQHLENAADQALRNGRLVHSAHLYVKAAHIADARGYTSEADAYIQHARRLAESPHLTQDEAALLREHVMRATATTDAEDGR